METRNISYGGTAAIVTSMALISGSGAAHATKPVIVSALLIAALADNLTDSLSIHIFQESEQLDIKAAFAGTIANFVTRLLLCLTFVPMVVFLSLPHAIEGAIIWGYTLLGTLTYLVARERKLNPLTEAIKHLLFAAVVISASMMIGHWIGTVLV